MIEYDKWYIFNNGSYRKDFIEEVKKNELLFTPTLTELKAQLLIDKVECIKLRNKVAYNYRTVYHSEYMQDAEVYVPDKYQKEYSQKYNNSRYNAAISMTEAWKLPDNKDTVYGIAAEEPCPAVTKCYKTEGDNMTNNTTIEDAINDVIKQFFIKNEKTICESAQKDRDLVIKQAEIVATAKPYYDAIRKYHTSRKQPCPDFINFVMPYLTDEEIDRLNEIDKKKEQYLNELKDHCNMVRALALQADTFEQRMEIYVSHNILGIAKKSKKTK